MPAPDTDKQTHLIHRFIIYLVYVLVKLWPYISLWACVKKHFKQHIHCPWKNGGNALASSILLVSIIVKKQGPIKIKN